MIFINKKYFKILYLNKDCIFENSSYYSPEEYRLIEKDVSPGSDTHCYTCMENRELNNLFIYMCH